jgi:hypothetical protein
MNTERANNDNVADELNAQELLRIHQSNGDNSFRQEAYQQMGENIFAKIAEAANPKQQLGKILPALAVTNEELNNGKLAGDISVYRASQAGKLPEGNGTAYYLPGTPVGDILSTRSGGWPDKIFTQYSDGQHQMQNKLLNLNADVSYGPSLLDGKQSIILDYPNHSIRGEMRQTGPNNDYLGIMYAHVSDSAQSTNGYVPLTLLHVHVAKNKK